MAKYLRRYKMPPPDARFWAKVNKTEGCWLWTGARSNGYGRFSLHSRLDLAHRVAWLLTHGEIPDGLWVLHRCDNRTCVNPDHLFLGTCQDNVTDMVVKGRNSHGESHYSKTHPEKLARGERLHSAKMTADRVVELRQRFAAGGVSKMALAREYGITHPTVRRIIDRTIWRHV